MTLLICRTCPRYDVPANGEFRRALDARIAQNPAADPTLIRHVHCLTGCPDDGVATLDGPGKARVRFTRLTSEHADALIKATHAHHACPSGAPEDWEIPAELVDHVSTVTYKRAPTSPAPSTRPRTPFVWKGEPLLAPRQRPTTARFTGTTDRHMTCDATRAALEAAPLVCTTGATVPSSRGPLGLASAPVRRIACPRLSTLSARAWVTHPI